MTSSGTGEWLEKALMELCKNMEKGLALDSDLISGLVSFCELAPPEDAKEYLNNIIGEEVGQSVIEEYMQLRGYTDKTKSVPNTKLQAYVKPPPDEGSISGTKKQSRATKEVPISHTQEKKAPAGTTDKQGNNKVNPGNSKKKKAGKAITLAEAAKGTVIFQQGKPCSCQARRHKLVSNCLSCGKIVCEQEGEGPCNFCGALVLREGSTYAGLEEIGVPLSDAEATAEAFAKRLVEYDRNSAARTTVIDDQSDYYELDSNNWISKEEKELLRKKQEEIEEADKARRNKVVVTFDLVGRKVLLNADESELESDNGILRQLNEREVNRIKPNPTLKVQPVFVDPGPRNKDPSKAKPQKKNTSTGLCLEISGRVQHEGRDQPRNFAEIPHEPVADGKVWRKPSVSVDSNAKNEEFECSRD